MARVASVFRGICYGGCSPEKRIRVTRRFDASQLMPAACGIWPLGPRLFKVWCGVSVENKKHGLPRIDHLRQSPAAVRFLSIEPLLEDLGPINLEGISWVIVGGESGPGARAMKKEWVISVRDQCRRAGVPFFFKQWGGVRKKAAGRKLDGRTYDEYPRRVSNPVLAPNDCLSLAAKFEAPFRKPDLIECIA